MLFRQVLQRPVVWIDLAVLLAAGVLAIGKEALRSEAPPGITLADLNSIDDLQARFNGDQGVARLVLVVSPT